MTYDELQAKLADYQRWAKNARERAAHADRSAVHNAETEQAAAYERIAKQLQKDWDDLR